MSCFIVSDNHLSAIIGYACRANLAAGWVDGRHIYQPGQEQEACDLLYQANVRSFNARYKEYTDETSCLYNAFAPKLLPIEVVKACDCLAYQCDEWTFFEGSPAERLIQDIRNAAIRRIPGYEAAKWSVE